MKKYPVTYKGKEYEVRWEATPFKYIVIYEVKHFWKIKYYRQRFYEYESEINRLVKAWENVPENDPSYYIAQVRTLFELWRRVLKNAEDEETAEIKKQKALAEWDGVIESGARIDA